MSYARDGMPKGNASMKNDNANCKRNVVNGKYIARRAVRAHETRFLQVYPAAGFAEEVAEHGGNVAVFNLDRTEGDEEADFLFLGPCEEKLPRALGLDSKSV